MQNNISQADLMHILQINIDYNQLKMGMYFSNGGWNYHISQENSKFTENVNEHDLYNQEMKKIHMERIFNDVIKNQPELAEKIDKIWERAHSFALLPYYISLELNNKISLESIKPILFKKHLNFQNEDEEKRSILLQNIIDNEPEAFYWLHKKLKKINHMDMTLFELYIKNLNNYENILLINDVKNDESINILLSADFKNKRKNLKRLKLIIQKDVNKSFVKYVEDSFQDHLKHNASFRLLFKEAYNKSISNLQGLFNLTKSHHFKIKIGLNDIYDHLGLKNNMQQNVLKNKIEEVFDKSFLKIFEKNQAILNINNTNTLILSLQIEFKDINLENKIEKILVDTNYYLMNLLNEYHGKGDDLLSKESDELLRLMNIYMTTNELAQLLQEEEKEEIIFRKKNKI